MPASPGKSDGCCAADAGGCAPAGIHARRGLAVELAREAGRLLLGSRPTGHIAKSSPTDIATDGDRAAEALIVGRLRAAFPEDSVLGEEGGLHSGTSGNRWVIDPLDGTVNYIYGIPQWSVSIGLEGRLRLGVIFDPSRDEIFTDEPGNGYPLAPSAQRELGQALIATGFSYREEVRARQGEIFRRVIPKVRDVRRGGSLALDLAWVACGRLDALYESAIHSWDVCAGIAMLQAAGGAVWTEADRIVAAGNQTLLERLMGVVLDGD